MGQGKTRPSYLNSGNQRDKSTAKEAHDQPEEGWEQ
jgi:hypothetical protein